jgi:hypothetical protein
LVLRTYASVFPRVSVWFTLSTDLLLIATDDLAPDVDLGRIAHRFARPDFTAAFARVGIHDLPALLAHEFLPFGVVHAMNLAGPFHTLRNPILSDHAARGFFVGTLARLPRYVRPPDDAVAARQSLLRRFAAQPDGSLPEPVIAAAAHETCRLDRMLECATWLALWQNVAPDSPARAGALARWSTKASARQELAPANLALLASLQAGAELPVPDAAVPDQQVIEATDAFLSHYTHAAPFDRRVLEALWRRCESPECGARRRQVERILGTLVGGRDLVDSRLPNSAG